MIAVLSIAWAQVSQAVMTLIWGPLPGNIIMSLSAGRIVFFSLAILQVGLIWHTAWRRMAVALALVGGIIGAAPVYSPHLMVLALIRAANHQPFSSEPVISAAIGLVLAACLAHGMVYGLRTRHTHSKGSTCWGSGKALTNLDQGFLLGKLNRQLLRYNRDGHLMTIAATRSGKGVGTVIPNLLEHTGGAVVTDPKGENYAATARYRSQRLGQQTIPLDPFRLSEASENQRTWAINPLDLIDTDGEDYVETAMMLADMIVGQTFDAGGNHWQMEAKALMFTYILHVAASEERSTRNLITVRKLITEPPDDMKETLSRMQYSKVAQVVEGAGRILQKSERERSAVFSTAQSRTHFLTSPRMQAVLETTNVHLSYLQKGLLSLYLIIPREYLTVYASWLRLMIACAYNVCTSRPNMRAGKQKSRRRVLFLLDEFANLGYMSNIKEAVSLGAGYGITLWLILQDLAQLRRTYKDEWESFVANCDVIQAFAIQDPFTSQKVAGMLGEMTIWERRFSKASRREGSHLKSGYSEGSRPLIKPDELRRLHPDRQILLVRPFQPVVADKLVYYKDPVFAPRAGITRDSRLVLPKRDKSRDTSSQVAV